MPGKRNRPLVEPLLWFLFVGGAICVAGGFWLADIYDLNHDLTYKLLAVFATELGFACLIAAIIYIVFEERMKRDEAKGIAAFLYGIETDNNYFRLIEDYIIRCPFFRTDTMLTYKFLKRSGEDLLIEYVIDYTVKNVSKVRKDFKVLGEVDEWPLYSNPHAGWRLGVTSVTVTRNGFASDPKMSYSEKPNFPQTKRFESEALRLKSRETAAVRVQHMIQKHDHDMDIWQAVMPCSGVKMRVEWPKEWPLRFGFEAFHPDADRLDHSKDSDEDICWLELSLDEPFMARHGLRLWWDSRQETPGPVPEPIPAIPARAEIG
jgi:hypothetical protein